MVRRYRRRALAPVSGTSRQPPGDQGASTARANPAASTTPAPAPNAAARTSPARPRSKGTESRTARGANPMSEGSTPLATPTRSAACRRSGNGGVSISRSRTRRCSILRRRGRTSAAASARAGRSHVRRSVHDPLSGACRHISNGASISRRTTPSACGPTLSSTAHDSGAGPRSRRRRALSSRRTPAMRASTCPARVEISPARFRWPSCSARRPASAARSAATAADSGGSSFAGGGPSASRRDCTPAAPAAAAADTSAAPRRRFSTCGRSASRMAGSVRGLSSSAVTSSRSRLQRASRLSTPAPSSGVCASAQAMHAAPRSRPARRAAARCAPARILGAVNAIVLRFEDGPSTGARRPASMVAPCGTDQVLVPVRQDQRGPAGGSFRPARGREG